MPWQLVTENYKDDWEERKKHIAVSLSLLRVAASVYLRQSISDSNIFNLMKCWGFTVSAELREHLFPLCSLSEKCSSSFLFSTTLPSIDVRSRVFSSGDFSVHLKSGSWILISCLFADSSCVYKSCCNTYCEILQGPKGTIIACHR